MLLEGHDVTVQPRTREVTVLVAAQQGVQVRRSQGWKAGHGHWSPARKAAQLVAEYQRLAQMAR
jgi:hypothetical protein